MIRRVSMPSAPPLSEVDIRHIVHLEASGAVVAAITAGGR